MLIEKDPLQILRHDFDFPKNRDKHNFLKKNSISDKWKSGSFVLIASAAVLRLKKACKLVKEEKFDTYVTKYRTSTL
jgi:hypothetical protein